MAGDEETPLIHRNGNDEFDEDLPPIKGCRDLVRQCCKESKRVWYLAGPCVFTILCRYALGAITQTFVGHIGELELAAFSIENSVIGGLSVGIMMGMGSALETLCGQAYGAKQLNMLGVYMQRSWVILNATAMVMTLIYVFAAQILKLIGQEADIADLAGKFARWMLPQLFAYAMNFPLSKFLQAQSKVLVMAAVAGCAVGIHALFSWLVIFKLGWGLVGAAVMLDVSWWFMVFCQLGYVLFSGSCKQAWVGFSWSAFYHLGAFARLSLASGVMLCLDVWYFYILILLAGYLKNPKIAVDAMSICVRVSNELGAGRPRAAKFAVTIIVGTMFTVGIIIMAIIFITKDKFAMAFTDSEIVMNVVAKLATLLAVTMLLNSVQPVLAGVAIGAGWQALVAYINIACYYIFGVPLGCLLGYYFDLGVEGIWIGMICGTTLQTLVLLIMIFRTKWNQEAAKAQARIKLWGGAT
uniref:Protein DETOXIFICATION n=1 Tax=Araucaria cunninghamii TaxID=56994 RepID=A0A0D6QYL7_ARACU